MSKACVFPISWPRPCVLTLGIEPYAIALRTPFGTSHSVTSSRTNALLSLTLTEGAGAGSSGACVRAFAEVGLPPKKPHVYSSDYADCADHFDALVGALRGVLDRWCGSGADRSEAAGPTLAELAGPGLEDLFPAVRGSRCGGRLDDDADFVACVDSACVGVLAALADAGAGAGRGPEGRAPRAGWEMAALHAVAAARGVPLSGLIGLPAPAVPPRAFYTAGLDAVPAMIKSAVFGRSQVRALGACLGDVVVRAFVCLYVCVCVCVFVCDCVYLCV
jgi:hypothetical protein